MSAPAKSDRELAILWDRLSAELQVMSEEAQQIALLLTRKRPSFDEASRATNLRQSLKHCLDAASGARAMMMLSVHGGMGRRS
jgi:predicted secreted Zn-dependent protease